MKKDKTAARRRYFLVVTLLCLFTMAGCSPMTNQNIKESKETVIGMHTGVSDDIGGEALLESMEGLAEQGINLLVVEVGYGYQYNSRKEIGVDTGLSYECARKIGEKGKELGIRIVPEIDCLGHQSWEKTNGKLLEAYPEFDETPGEYPGNKDIYCRSYCPLEEDVYPVMFDLMDELIVAFDADAFHVGMDEVFLIGEESCPRCAGKDKGELFALAVNKLYDHLVTQKGVEMYMWADRLLDGKELGDVYSEWDASYNETHKAIDNIPKDIILMDWHYDWKEEYPSVEYLANKGFRVITASYNDVEATRSFILDTNREREQNPLVAGHIYTTWYDIGNEELANWKPMIETIALLK